MNPHLKFLFPQSLYVVDGFMADKLSTFEGRVKDIVDAKGTTSNKMLSVKSSFKTYDRLFEDEVFKELAEGIKTHVISYLHELGLGHLDNTIKYSKMWFNVSHQGEFNIPHIHGNSVISGAYYVKTSTNNKITFFKDIACMMPQPDPITELGKTIEEIDCVPSRLVLFRSDFVHGNGAQEDGEKIVISFNLGITEM